MKVKNDRRSNFSNLSSWKKKPGKNQGFNGVRTREAWSLKKKSEKKNQEVTGSNPVEALIFFRLLPSNCLSCKIYCGDHSLLSNLFCCFNKPIRLNFTKRKHTCTILVWRPCPNSVPPWVTRTEPSVYTCTRAAPLTRRRQIKNKSSE